MAELSLVSCRRLVGTQGSLDNTMLIHLQLIGSPDMGFSGLDSRIWRDWMIAMRQDGIYEASSIEALFHHLFAVSVAQTSSISIWE